jgi:hypothetical protein
MALDAYEGEQRLNHTEVNREHVWRLLQGGELIAPIPSLPPRETPPEQAAVTEPAPVAKVSPMDVASVTNVEAPPPPVKKTRARKKVEAKAADTAEPGSIVQVEEGVTPPATPPKRGRKKKTADEAGVTVNREVEASSESEGPAPQASTDATAGAPPTKPKRTRRVGEQETEHGL